MIKAFMTEVKRGLISGRDNSSAPEVLQEMVAALQDILKGEDTDKALQIERQAGGPTEWKTIALACLVHQHRKAGDKWAVVELKVNKWLRIQGFDSLSERRLTTIYKDNLDWLQRRESIADMVETQEAISTTPIKPE